MSGLIPDRLEKILQDAEARKKLFLILTRRINQSEPIMIGEQEYFVRRIEPRPQEIIDISSQKERK